MIIYKGYDIIGDHEDGYYIQDFSQLSQPTSKDTYPTIEAAKIALDNGKVDFV